MARIIQLPITLAGRALLREAATFIGGWGKPGGAALEEFDWDASAAEDERQGLNDDALNEQSEAR